MTAYYNEIDPYAAQWLRNLIAAGHLPTGDVDERSIEDVRPDELAGYEQCHFFAGIGGWPYALRLAGWPDEWPVWTGSCPCQPFSAAGKRKGTTDDRHLWPAFHWLIQQCRPLVVFGEQVASRDGLAWLDIVSTDLEADGYTCGAVNLPACGVGAPHIRQRLWWVADANGRNTGSEGLQRSRQYGHQQTDGCPSIVADSNGEGSLSGTLGGVCVQKKGAGPRDGEPERRGDASGLADSKCKRICSCKQRRFGKTQNCLQRTDGERKRFRSDFGPSNDAMGAQSNSLNGFWRDADWLRCRDEKWRPVEPGSFPLASGIPARVGKLRAYGNAIVPQAGAAFVAAYMEAAI